MKEIVVTSKVIRHHPQFARLVTIPFDKVAPWKLNGTTTVEGTINDTELGRRSLKRWDERACWWIDLPEALCRKAKLETGDSVNLPAPSRFRRSPGRINAATQRESGGQSALDQPHVRPATHVA